MLGLKAKSVIIYSGTLKGKANVTGPDWDLGFQEGYKNASSGNTIEKGPRGEYWYKGEYGNGYAEGNLSGGYAFYKSTGAYPK